MRSLVLILAYLLSLAMIAAAYGAEGAPLSAPFTVPAPAPAASAEDAAFAAFLQDFRGDALAAGIAPETYDSAIAGITRNQKVVDHTLNQPEFAKPVWAYIDSAVSPRRISEGRSAAVANAAILAEISAKYKIPGEILVSVWGNESDYGRGQGGYKMIEALATLAYDGPRTGYARPQLIAALKMAEREHYDPAAMTSSWAGAFGQTQFVPTTFLAAAVDGDNDGKIDLWGDSADALASTANVLAKAGWAPGKPWGYEVTLPPGFAYDEADLDTTKPVAVWKKAGVKTAAGQDLPLSSDPAAIFLPAGARGPAFLVFANFKAILRYNNAATYALAVCLLGDQIKPALVLAQDQLQAQSQALAANTPPGEPATADAISPLSLVPPATNPVSAAWPRELAPLSRDARLSLQDSLVKLGYDIGKVDGMIGAKSRAALRGWQKAHGLPADGFATQELIAAVTQDASAKTGDAGQAQTPPGAQ